MHRITRLGLGVALAVVASAPLTASSHASTCNSDQFPEVCAAITAACQATVATGKVCSLIR